MDIMLQKCKKAEIFLGSHTTVYDSIMFNAGCRTGIRLGFFSYQESLYLAIITIRHGVKCEER